MLNKMVLGLTTAALALAVLPAESQAQKWGSLSGKFVVDGKAPAQKKLKVTKDNAEFGNEVIDDQLRIDDKGGVADVVVYVRSKIDAKAIHADYDKVPAMVGMDNKGGRFIPHVVTVWTKKQTLVMGNPDKVAHNSNIQPAGDPSGTGNPLLPPGSMHNFKFGRQQNVPAPVACNIHPWMKGYVLPRDNPYMTVSAEDGTFEIKNLPVGEHEFQLWHDPKNLDIDGAKNGRVKVTIKEGKNQLPMADKNGVVKVPASTLEGK
ncbi:MAG: hypothetical protein AB7O62_12000 [Pirellulales bacterium]